MLERPMQVLKYSEDFNEKAKSTVSDHQKAYTKFCVVSTNPTNNGTEYRNRNRAIVSVKSRSNYVKQYEKMRESYLQDQRSSMKSENTTKRYAKAVAHLTQTPGSGLIKSRTANNSASLDPTSPANNDLINPSRKFTSSIAKPVTKIVHSSNKSTMRQQILQTIENQDQYVGQKANQLESEIYKQRYAIRTYANAGQKKRKSQCKTLLIQKQHVQVKHKVTEYDDDNEEPEILTGEKSRFKGARIASAKQRTEPKNQNYMEKMKSQNNNDYFNVNIFGDNAPQIQTRNLHSAQVPLRSIKSHTRPPTTQSLLMDRSQNDWLAKSSFGDRNSQPQFQHATITQLSQTPQKDHAQSRSSFYGASSFVKDRPGQTKVVTGFQKALGLKMQTLSHEQAHRSFQSYDMNSYTDNIEKRKTSGHNPRIKSALGKQSSGISSRLKNDIYQPDKSNNMRDSQRFFQNGLSNALAAHERSMKSRQSETRQSVAKQQKQYVETRNNDISCVHNVQVNITLPQDMKDPEEELNYNTGHLLQLVPEYEEVQITDFQEYDEKAFGIFKTECEQDVQNTISEMNTRHIEFSGQMVKGLKEGKGGFIDKLSNDFFHGSWLSNQKNGYGIQFFGPKSNQINFQLLEEMFRISKQEIKPVVYKGHWNGNQISGEGYLKFSNDLIIYGAFQQNQLKDSQIQILYPNGDIYCGKHKGGIKNGDGNYMYKSSNIKYIGEWKDDKKHGKGEMVFPMAKGKGEISARLSGMFDHDELFTGEYMDSLGNVFKSRKYDLKDVRRIQEFITEHFQHQHNTFEHGHFKKGRLHGWGEVEYRGGDCYRGMFKDGKRSGYGIMSINQYNDVISQYVPARFEGEWKFNKRNGYGEMEWPDKSKFSGQWSNDCRVQGKLEMPDENYYEGTFQNDLMHGPGKITYVRDNIVYEGLFHKGQASNIGRVTNQNENQVYIGEIENSDTGNKQRQGVGILIDVESNRRFEGEFEDDIPMGLGKITYPNGDIYIGMVEKFNKQGPGRLESNGKIFEGEFNKDQKEGVGYYFYNDGKVYCGQFKQDKEEGIGEFLSEKDIENNFKSIDKVKFKILTDKLFKICRQLKPLGVQYNCIQPGVSF